MQLSMLQAAAAAGAPNNLPPAPHKPTGVRPPYAVGPAAAMQAAGQQQPQQWRSQPQHLAHQQVPPQNWQQPGPSQQGGPQQWQQHGQPQQQQQLLLPSQQWQQQSHVQQPVNSPQQPPGQSTPYSTQQWQRPGVGGAGSGGGQQSGGSASGVGAAAAGSHSRRPNADDAGPPAKRRLSF